MKTEDNQIGKTKILRATIGIITSGGPVIYQTYRDTKPVMLKGMQLPAEARYSFTDPTDHSANFVNHPVSFELFFGDNGTEESDCSLGNFQVHKFLPPYTGSRKIKLILEVSSDQILRITLLGAKDQKKRSIGFIDISALDPPEIKLFSKPDESENIKFIQSILETEGFPIRQTAKPHRGKDLAQNVTISFDEALHGGSKDIEVAGTQTCSACTGSGLAPGKNLSPCSNCQGTGWAKKMIGTANHPQYEFAVCANCKGDGLVNLDPCQACWGNGWVSIKRSLTFRIPVCIDSGAIYCMPHQGEPGQFGGLPGHLQITVNVAAHPFLTRSGHDIYVNLPVSTDIARKGGRLRVPALEKGSSFLLDLPAGTRSNAECLVSENEAYSLTARIETYRPAFLFMQPDIKQRINAIREWLGDADIEIPDKGESELGGRISTLPGPELERVCPAPGRSTQQAEFYNRRGVIYVNMGDGEHSLDDFNMALELDPEYASTYANRGVWYCVQKEYGKALADLNKALELAPNNAEYYFHRGKLFFLQKDLAKALADYNKALELDPTYAKIYECRGDLYSLQNNLQATLTDFNKSLELDPTNVNCYLKRGVLYQFKGDLAKGIADYTRALELDPENIPAHNERSRMYIQLNDLENALADVNRIVAKQPKYAEAYNNRAYIYFLQNDFAKALADYDKALELDPNLVSVYEFRGKTYLKQNRYDQAIEDFKKSISVYPEDSGLYLWLGQAYQGLGKKKIAIECYQKALPTSQDSELCQEAQKLLLELGVE